MRLNKHLKRLFILLLVFSWLLSSWPPVWLNPRFPPEIPEIKEAQVFVDSAQARPRYGPADEEGYRERLDLRQPTSKTFQAADGTHAWVGTIGPTHYQNDPNNPNEEWEDIDTRVVGLRMGEYEYGNETNTFRSYFKPDPTSQDSVRYQYGESFITFTLLDNELGVRNSVEGFARDNQFVYPSAYENIDVRYSITPTQLLEEFVLRQPMEISAVTQRIHFENARMQQEDGAIVFYALDSNEQILEIPRPVMYEDANPAAVSFGLHYELIPTDEPNTYLLIKVIDEEGKAWLSQATYPVVIDATINTSVPAGVDDAHHCTTFSNSASNLCWGNMGTGIYTMWLRFTNITIPPGSVINSSSIGLTRAQTGGTGGNPDVTISGIDEANTLTFGTDPSTRPLTTATSAPWAPADAASWTTPALTTVVQEVVDLAGWASGNALGFKFATSTSNYLRQRYAAAYEHTTLSQPTLTIDYTASTTTLGTGTDPATATVAPGSAIRDAGAFTFQTSAGTDSITALTVTLAASGTPYNGVGEVRITNSAGTTTYFSAIANPTSNTLNFSGGTAIPASTTLTTFKIRVTPKTHAAMAAPPGAAYNLSPYVSAWTSGNSQVGSDGNANTLTIDNLSPSGATGTSGSAGNTQVTLNWTTSSSADFSRSVVLRWAAGTPGSQVPAEGTDYSVGNTIGTATVACVRTADAASTAVSGTDGAGTGGCSAVALTNGQAYSYKVFQKDSNGNYDIGVTFTGSPFTPQAPTFTQSAYRLFNNLDSTNVGTPLAAQDTAATLGATGDAFRLRALIHVGTSNLPLNGQTFKLQFAQQSGTCDTGFVGETYADVTAATVIAYNNNAPADGDNLTANANDPTHGGDTIVNQDYEELNNFTNSVAAITAGQDGKWDFALFDNGATGSTAYCFRAVKSDATVLNTYTVIPQITTAAAGPTNEQLLRHGDWFSSGVEQPYTF